APIAACAISSALTGRCRDMLGVWMEPVTAQVMTTLRVGMAERSLSTAGRRRGRGHERAQFRENDKRRCIDAAPIDRQFDFAHTHDFPCAPANACARSCNPLRSLMYKLALF